MTFKEKVTAAAPMTGTHVHLTDPIVTEIFASLGYDFIWVDMEHTHMSCEQAYHHILAARAGGTPVIVRVPKDDLTVTKRIMEIGPDGIIFPMVRDVAHAKELLNHTLYPPYGTRGYGPKGAIRYGLDNEPAYYGEGHLKKHCRFVQIELKSAAEDAENIAALPYLDGCILGMHDLSGSINHLGDVFCEENVALANKAIAAFKAAGKTVGVSTGACDADTLRRYRDMGVNMISTGADFDYLLKKGQETLATMRKVREE